MKRILLVCVATLGVLQGAFAQEEKKFELGVGGSFGFSLKKEQPNSYGFDLFGGYKFNPHFTTGLGVNYINYFGRTDLPSGDANLYVETGQYHAFRPYLYTRFDFLPEKKWSPFIGAKLGYAFFSDTHFLYRWGQNSYGLNYGNVPAEYEHILTDPAQTLGVGNNVFGTIDLGVSRRIGNRGSKLSLGVSLDLQPVKFNYNNSEQKKFAPTIGPSAKISF